jgi:hypothetical protein
MRLILLCLLAITCFFTGNAQTNSVLSEGTWFKIAIPSSGVYSLSYQDLKNLGVKPELINPKKIAIYGNGGKMLPQPNSEYRVNDLIENAIWVQGEEDGVFSSNDKIIFYAEGPHTWQYNSISQNFNHKLNLYDNTNYYFLRIDQAEDGKRIHEAAPESLGQILRSYNERTFHEKDLINVNQSGRIWLGEMFDDVLERSFTFDLSGITSSTYRLEIATAGRSTRYNSESTPSKPSMKISVNEHEVETITYSTNIVLSQNQYVPATDYKVSKYNLDNITIQNGNIVVALEYNKNGVLAPNTDFLYAGFLDYIKVEFERKFDFSTFNQKSFRSIASLEAGSYSFKYPKSDKIIWNVTDPLHPVSKPIETLEDSSFFSFSGGDLKEFIAFDPNLTLEPANITAISNQNIHGLTTSPELVIFTSPGLKNSAQKLADFHRTYSGLEVLLVTTDEVYNEFSSGKRDVSSIRDLCRYFYQKDEQLKYLLLFGMGSHDYKSTDGDAKHFIPIYQSRETFHIINSYASDDYFGFMDDSEGEWNETSSGNHTMDIGVGRLPVRNLKEAEIVVDKIITYASDPKSMGNWRNRITLFADDGDSNLHLRDTESTADSISTNYQSLNIRKLYLGRYRKVLNPGREYSADMSQALTKTINDGTLVFNYVGHGAPRRLGFGIIDAEQPKTWNNKYKLPFFITATCEFALADRPDVYSLGREIVLMKDRGAIGIFSGTRAAYASSNKIIVSSLTNYLFDPTLRLGDVIRKAKNGGLSGIFNRHFIFMGDPALKLNIPTQEVRLSSVNGNLPTKRDTLTALSVNHLEGEVTDRDGNLLSNFNGKIHLTVYNKEKTITTLGQIDPIRTFRERDQELFSGITHVTNGLFSVEFMLPKEAADSLGSAKISMYAYSNDGLDAAGHNSDQWTGGYDPNAPADFTPPTITMYLDTITFTSGDTVNSRPTLIAELSDESGINQSSTDPNNYLVSLLNLDSSIVMNGHYVADAGDYTKGTLQYQFHRLTTGNYTLELWASDNYNNRTFESIDFIVFDTATSISHPVVSNFLKLKAFPNPFNDQTNLVLKQSNNITATISIHDATGRLIRLMDQVSISANQPIQWDGKDFSGSKVPQGIYTCTISIPEKQAQQSIMLMVR